MLKKVVLALALAAAGFAPQSASANPISGPAVIADGSGVSVQQIQYYDPPPRYERRYEGRPRRYDERRYEERRYWRRGYGPPPWARPWWRRHHERPYWERREYYGRRW